MEGQNGFSKALERLGFIQRYEYHLEELPMRLSFGMPLLVTLITLLTAQAGQAQATAGKLQCRLTLNGSRPIDAGFNIVSQSENPFGSNEEQEAKFGEYQFRARRTVSGPDIVVALTIHEGRALLGATKIEGGPELKNQTLTLMHQGKIDGTFADIFVSCWVK